MKKILLAVLLFGGIGAAYACDGYWSGDWSDISWSHHEFRGDNYHCNH